MLYRRQKQTPLFFQVYLISVQPKTVYKSSQIFHTLTSRLVIAVYNCIITKIHNKNCLRAWGTPLRPKDETRSKSGSRLRTPRALLHKIYTIYMSYARKKVSNKCFNHNKPDKVALGSKKAPEASSHPRGGALYQRTMDGAIPGR